MRLQVTLVIIPRVTRLSLGIVLMFGLSPLLLAEPRPAAPAQSPVPESVVLPSLGFRVQMAEKRLAPYHALVRQYRSGDREPAIHELGTWMDSRLQAVREELAQLRSDLFPEGSAPAARWDVTDLRAAVLLETERALVYVLNDRKASSASVHLETARFLLECVDPKEEGFAEFRLEWWRNVVSWLQRGVNRDGLRLYALRAIALYPNDAQVRLAAGTPFEIALRVGCGRAPETPSEPLVARNQFLRRRADRAGTEDARFALENLTAAIRLAPHAPEALLRRGRAFQLTGQDELAIADFRAVLALDAPGSFRYLAHLFLGSVHQTAFRPRLDDARREYEAAMKEAPEAQSARLALSTVLLLMGDREGAESLAQETLELPSETAGGLVIDPWSTYGLGLFPQALSTFSRMRTTLWGKRP